MQPSFTIPSVDKRLAHLAETRPKYLQAWLEQLHTSDPEAASSSILPSLSALNRQPLASNIRLKLLNLYWNTIQLQVNMLQLQLSGSMLPLSEKAEAHIRLAGNLLLELGNGYKLVLMDDTSQGGVNSQSDTAPVIYQLLLLQQRMLELCYEMYRTVPVDLWKEIHHTYQHADAHGDTDVTIQDSTFTISHVYRQILLVALADPYHLMQGELALVMELARVYVPLCKLGRSYAATHSTTIFTLNTLVDAPPHIATHLESDTHGNSIRFFNTHQLIEHLLHLLAKLESGVAPDALGLSAAAAEPGFRNLLQRLIRSWGIPHLRRFNRYDNQLDNIELTIGLRTVHTLLSHPAPSNFAASSNMHPTLNGSKLLDSQKTGHELGIWQIFNNSAQGHALRNKGTTPAHIKVGELIAMQEHSGRPLNLCVIKWIKGLDKLIVEMGVQLLPPHARPVTVYNALSPIKNVQPGMLFPENTTLKQRHLLLTPHGIYMKKVAINLIDDTTLSIMPGKRILQTQSFDLFEFTLQ